jgi:hypothetical protein
MDYDKIVSVLKSSADKVVQAVRSKDMRDNPVMAPRTPDMSHRRA